MFDNFDDWLAHGIKMGWCGPALCYTHDGVGMTNEENQEFEDGGDPCLHVLRLYETPEMKAEIEANHAPSVWRQPRSDAENTE